MGARTSTGLGFLLGLYRGSSRAGLGNNTLMRTVALLVVLGAVCFAGEVGKPACNAENHGRLWPEAANASPDAARLLSRSGELEMCSLVVWKYRWERLSVNVRDLEKRARKSSLPR